MHWACVHFQLSMCTFSLQHVHASSWAYSLSMCILSVEHEHGIVHILCRHFDGWVGPEDWQRYEQHNGWVEGLGDVGFRPKRIAKILDFWPKKLAFPRQKFGISQKNLGFFPIKPSLPTQWLWVSAGKNCKVVMGSRQKRHNCYIMGGRSRNTGKNG